MPFGGDPGLLRPRWRLDGDGDGVPSGCTGRTRPARRALPCRVVPCRAVRCSRGVGAGAGAAGAAPISHAAVVLAAASSGARRVAMGRRDAAQEAGSPPPVRGLRGLPEQGSLRAARSPPQPGLSSRPCSPRPRVPSSLATCSPAFLQPWPLDVRVYPLPPWPDPPSRTGPWWRGGHLSRGVLSGAPGGSLGAAWQPGAPSRAPGAKLQRGRRGRLAPALG